MTRPAHMRPGAYIARPKRPLVHQAGPLASDPMPPQPVRACTACGRERWWPSAAEVCPGCRAERGRS